MSGARGSTSELKARWSAGEDGTSGSGGCRACETIAMVRACSLPPGLKRVSQNADDGCSIGSAPVLKHRAHVSKPDGIRLGELESIAVCSPPSRVLPGLLISARRLSAGWCRLGLASEVLRQPLEASGAPRPRPHRFLHKLVAHNWRNRSAIVPIVRYYDPGDVCRRRLHDLPVSAGLVVAGRDRIL